MAEKSRDGAGYEGQIGRGASIFSNIEYNVYEEGETDLTKRSLMSPETKLKVNQYDHIVHGQVERRSDRVLEWQAVIFDSANDLDHSHLGLQSLWTQGSEPRLYL